ncbi:MAG: DUF11 domain-containing protein [Gammaproteobacteria bacterium]|nr:DUF11 domain-containing protein [Gammaproteobacteria bacterium]
MFNKKELAQVCVLTLALMLAMPAGVYANVGDEVCIGKNYEGGKPPVQVTPPTVFLRNSNDSAQIIKGEAVTLIAEATVDTQSGGVPNYYWCAEAGRFIALPDFPDLSRVMYFAPSDIAADKFIRVVAQVGDGLNSVRGDSLYMQAVQALPGSETGPYSVEGQIVDESGMPVADAVVEAAGHMVLTDENGNYQITGLPEGEHAVSATKEGVSIIADGETPPVGPFRVKVWVRDTFGMPIPGVTVEIAGYPGISTDESGRGEIIGLGGDVYTLTAHKAGYAFKPEEFLVSVNEPEANVVLKQVSNLAVAISQSAGRIDLGGSVTYSYTLANSGDQTATDVELRIPLPKKVVLESVTSAQGDCLGTETLNCALGELAAGASVTVEAVITPQQQGKVKHTALLTANEYPNAQDGITTHVSAHLRAWTNVMPYTVNPGKNQTYRIILDSGRFAPSPVANITVTLDLPADVPLVSAPTDCAVDGARLVCAMEDLPANSRAKFDVVLAPQAAGRILVSGIVTGAGFSEIAFSQEGRIAIPEPRARLYFVIDDTGSMREEIVAIRQALVAYIDFAGKAAESGGHHPPAAGLITFKDKNEIVRHVITPDLDELLAKVNKLSAKRGGDCPEDSVIALNLAAEKMISGGIILFATDAPPHADADLDGLIENLRSRGLSIRILLSKASCEMARALHVTSRLRSRRAPEPDAKKAKSLRSGERTNSHFDTALNAWTRVAAETGNGSTLVVLNNEDQGSEDWNQQFETEALNVMISALQPAITGITPASVRQGETLEVTVSASAAHFNAGSLDKVQIGGGIEILAGSVLSSGHMTLRIRVPETAELGYYDIAVETVLADGSVEPAIGTGILEIAAAPASPQIDPNQTADNGSDQYTADGTDQSGAGTGLPVANRPQEPASPVSPEPGNPVLPPPAVYSLTVSIAGEGEGSVGDFSGIDCGTDCEEDFTRSANVVLIAAPEPGSRFTGWSDDCDGMDNSVSVNVNRDKICTANFEKALPSMYSLTVIKTGDGEGTISGIDCGTDCTESFFTQGASVALTAAPAAGSSFRDWSGDCSGTKNSVSVRVDRDKICMANFDLFQTLVITKKGKGTLFANNVENIDCGEEVCSARYPKGTELTLTAKPGTWMRFAGFSGDEDCRDGQVTLNAPLNCTAAFVCAATDNFVNCRLDNANGSLRAIRLGPQGEIIGGELGGTISGSAENRALLENVRISADAELSRVLIGEGVAFEEPASVTLNDVRFISNEAIPPGIDLRGALAFFPTDGRRAVQRIQLFDVLDLRADVVDNADGLLEQLNRLADLAGNGFELVQNRQAGQLEVRVEEFLFSIVPFEIRQAGEDAVPGVYVRSDGGVVFVTHTRREIIAQAGIQDINALEDALPSDVILSVLMNGNIVTPDDESGYWYVLRPAMHSEPVEEDESLEADIHPLLQDAPTLPDAQSLEVDFVFADERKTEENRRQYFYPAPLYPDEWVAWFEADPARELVSNSNGSFFAVVDGYRFRGVFDSRYQAAKGEAYKRNPQTQGSIQGFELIPEGSVEDVKGVYVIYSTGEKQAVWFVEPPEKNDEQQP